MSASFFGSGGGGHQGQARFLWIGVLGVFLALWIGNAVIHSWEMAHDVSGGAGHAATPSAAESLYRSLQLFHFHDTHWSDHPKAAGYVARFSASAYALGLPLLVLGWFCRGGLRRWRHWAFGRGFVVIVGDGDEARQLAAELAQRGRAVLLCTSDGHTGPHLSQLMPVEGDPATRHFWRDVVRAQQARAVVLMAEDDATNIRWSLALERALQGRKAGAPLACHLHLADLHLRKGLVSLLPASSVGSPLERRFFNRYEISARLLARRYPLPSTLVEESALPEHYVIIGFGQFGQNVALKLVKMGQQIVRKQTATGSRFEVCHPRVTVIDRRGEEAAAAFLSSHPGFPSTCRLEIVRADCHDPEFRKLEFLNRLDPAERCSLIFCLQDEPMVVGCILMMLDVCANPSKDINGIYLHASGPDGPAELLRRHPPATAATIPIVTFGADREIWTEDVVLNLSLDTMAEQIHEAYLGVAKAGAEPGNRPPAASKTWLALSPEDRDSNREAADNLWAKLRTLGYGLETAPLASRAADHSPTEADRALEAEIEARLHELASSEHYRWMAWRLIDGWTYDPDRDNRLKKHPDLVSYEDLSPHAQDKDKMIVRIIPRLLRAGRLHAKKEPVN